MGRVFLTVIIPLLLPTALYVLWRMLPGRGPLLSASWVWLVIAGLGLVALTLIVISIDFGAPRNGTYVPPHLSNGQVVPGYVAPAKP